MKSSEIIEHTRVFGYYELFPLIFLRTTANLIYVQLGHSISHHWLTEVNHSALWVTIVCGDPVAKIEGSAALDEFRRGMLGPVFGLAIAKLIRGMQ